MTVAIVVTAPAGAVSTPGIRTYCAVKGMVYEAPAAAEELPYLIGACEGSVLPVGVGPNVIGVVSLLW